MQWVFFRNGAGQWCWECCSGHGVLKESRRAFSTRRDCVADAMRYGFVAAPVMKIEPTVRAPARV